MCIRKQPTSPWGTSRANATNIVAIRILHSRKTMQSGENLAVQGWFHQMGSSRLSHGFPSAWSTPLSEKCQSADSQCPVTRLTRHMKNKVRGQSFQFDCNDHLATFTLKVTVFAPPAFVMMNLYCPSAVGVTLTEHFGPGESSLATSAPEES
jgi:hypothetical protein